jgi:hypothetical protein
MNVRNPVPLCRSMAMAFRNLPRQEIKVRTEAGQFDEPDLGPGAR